MREFVFAFLLASIAFTVGIHAVLNRCMVWIDEDGKFLFERDGTEVACMVEPYASGILQHKSTVRQIQNWMEFRKKEGSL